VPWLVAVALALVFAVVAAHHGERGLLLFECLAALLPLAGVAAAFGPGLDPAYEVGAAAPFSSLRLLLIRSAAVLVASVLLAGLAAIGLPGHGWTAVAWLLPSLALTTASLALATYMSPRAAFAVVTATWLAVAAASAAGGGDELAAFRGGGQIVFLLLAAVATVVLVLHRDRLDLRKDL
jgi:hypothetical protein